MEQTNFEFGNSAYLYALYAIIVFVALYVFARVQNKKRMRLLVDSHLQNVIVPDYSKNRTLFRFILFLLAYVCFVFALAGPRFGTKLVEVKRKGVELVIALDVSNSMLAEDISPNRIEKAKLSIQRLMDGMQDDKVGLVIFAGDAYTQLPLTTDISASKMFLQTIQTNFVAKQGTAIGAAIGKAMRSFTNDEKVGKAIIVISDGENHEDDAIRKAKEAQEKGITVHTIGMGQTEGSPIIRKDGYGRKYFMKDKSGKPVTTKLNEQMLQEVAKAGGGVYSRADFAPVVDALQGMNESEFEMQKYSEYDEKYQYFLALGILFLLIEILIKERKNKFLDKFSPFEISKKENLNN